ncbi:Mor transcription activator family protein [Turicibacter sanguinis]|uniref:Mor transcription activator family protein n=1 Tax=Turicibacter sanguinis TaxID=154288 RepID=UPI00232ACDB6|nr:Mor transcription activator family protein [Turicibacter sanguinis]MDB8460343.1 Mor transcription activator family protein [Turicibacter sanguinis]
MKKHREDYQGIYQELVELIGEEMTQKFYQYYKGQQITFPVRMYSKEYVRNYLSKHYNGQNLRQLSRELGYSERWMRQLMKQYAIEIKVCKVTD